MKKIIDTKIKDNKLTFIVVSDVAITNTTSAVLLIDEANNIDMLFSPTHKEHSYVIKSSDSTFTIVEKTLTGAPSQVTVDHVYEVSFVSDVVAKMNVSTMKYLQLYITTQDAAFDAISGVYYSAEELYNAEISLLKKHCSTCLDDKLMKTIMVVVFKKQLFDLAMEAGNFVNAVKYYFELCKVLGITIDTDDKKSCAKRVCINGVCSIVP